MVLGARGIFTMKQVMAVSSEPFDSVARVFLEGCNGNKSFVIGEGDKLELTVTLEVEDGVVFGEITGRREIMQIEESPDDGIVESRRHSG